MAKVKPRTPFAAVEKFGANNGKTSQNPDKPLNDREKLFTELVITKGLSIPAAYRQAYPDSANSTNVNVANWARRLSLKPNVQKYAQKLRAQYEATSMMTKKKVMDGFLEAIEMAKAKGDPFVMISGWREIAKMCGYFEAQKHKIDISVNGNIMVQKLQALSDEELLRLADGNVIEGEIIPKDDKPYEQRTESRDPRPSGAEQPHESPAGSEGTGET